jgi:hypothetical protein
MVTDMAAAVGNAAPVRVVPPSRGPSDRPTSGSGNHPRDGPERAHARAVGRPIRHRVMIGHG